VCFQCLFDDKRMLIKLPHEAANLFLQNYLLDVKLLGDHQIEQKLRLNYKHL
jgi:hypothetical protein